MKQSQEEVYRFNKRRKIFLFIITLLLLINGFFFFNQMRVKRKMQEMEAKKQELDSIYSVALNDLKAINKEVENLKSLNGESDSILAQQRAEILAKRDSIVVLLKKDELNTLEIFKLRKWVETLRTESYQYWETAQQINQKLEQEKNMNDSLKAVVIQNETALNAMNLKQGELQATVTAASLLKPYNIKVSGLKIRRNGNETYTNIAKKASKILICFDVPENKFSTHEPQRIYVRLLHPTGSTISTLEQHIEVIDEPYKNHPIRYTLAIDFEYEGKSKNVCAYWQQNTLFSKGIYKLEFFQKQYFIGESQFELK